ncbi:MAG TPA: NfeD family protein [Phenylobacterium sp.]|nr:NfeD family protein [Phenylobacterium sp.]
MADIADLLVTHPFWLWLIVAAIILAVEVATGSGWLLWPAGAAAVVGFTTLALPLSLPLELLVFAMLTIVTTLLARRYLPRSLANDGSPDINDNVARLVGHRGRVAEAFTGGHGRVDIDGKEWAAELDAGGDLASGAAVEVVGVAGARITVRAIV